MEVSYRRFPDINRHVLTELLPNHSFISQPTRKRVLELFPLLSMTLLRNFRPVVDTNDYTHRYTVAPCRGLARSICQIVLASFSPAPCSLYSLVPWKYFRDDFAGRGSILRLYAIGFEKCVPSINQAYSPGSRQNRLRRRLEGIAIHLKRVTGGLESNRSSSGRMDQRNLFSSRDSTIRWSWHIEQQHCDRFCRGNSD